MTGSFRLRVVLDTEEDVIRDIDISADTTLDKLHHTIVEAFDLDKGEMASFYRSNDNWDQGEEICLMDFGDQSHGSIQMDAVTIANALGEKGARMIYVYDYLNLWTFFVETVRAFSAEESAFGTRSIKISGERPKEAPVRDMESTNTGFDFDDDLESLDADDYSDGSEW